MNHGVINKNYYKGKENNNKLLVKYPILNTFKNYFSNHKSRDRYYVAMKYHAIQQIKLIAPEITWQYLGEIMGGMHHASVMYYCNGRYTPLNDHDLFIKDNFNMYIESFLYPISTRHFSYSTQRNQGDFIGRHLPLTKTA
tara:strand:- start:12490 stop:12909 length:420 start_codon:yes stop_codon:yes gene_type:complete